MNNIRELIPNKIELAIHLATKYHAGQKRKYTGEDYVTHPIAVKNIILNHFGPNVKESILVSAILHDMLEDTHYTEHMMAYDFGFEVLKIVKALTNSKTGNRKKRKILEAEMFADIDSEIRESAYVVRLADIIHNAPSIRKHDKNFWKTYREEKENLLLVIRKNRPELVHPLFNKLLELADRAINFFHPQNDKYESDYEIDEQGVLYRICENRITAIKTIDGDV